MSDPSPVKMFFYHFGDGAGHGLLLWRQALVETDSQPLLQEVYDKFCAVHLFLVVLNPWHFPLW